MLACSSLGYARSAAMKVSWKQSSASCGPTEATRKPSTSEPCSSSSAWKGGRGLIRHSPIKRRTPGFRETVRERWRSTADTRELVARALLEDLGPGDVTAEAVVPEDATGRATITQKAPGVLFGLDVAAEVFRQAGAGELEAVAAESEWRDEVPAEVARAAGPARALLAAERTALNLLGHLSGCRDPDRAVRPGGRGHGGAGSSTRARPRRDCGRWRRPRWRRAAAPTTGWASTTRS